MAIPYCVGYEYPEWWLKGMASIRLKSRKIRAKADKAHKHKKDVRKQKQHLKAIKTEKQLKQIRLASQHKQVSKVTKRNKSCSR